MERDFPLADSVTFRLGPELRCSNYVRRMEWRMKSSEAGNSAFSNGLRCVKRNGGAGLLKSISVVRACRLLSRRAGKTTVLVLLTVKSFEALSVRDRSSGNSPPTIPHSSRSINAWAITLAIPVCLRSILKLRCKHLYTRPKLIKREKCAKAPFECFAGNPPQ